MSLRLVVGPANAEKAGVVLDAYRDMLDHDPLLVVPTAADVDRYRRELAGSGAVFGVEVLRFGWLMREIARRAAIRGATIGPLARERAVAAAIAGARLGPLAGSATTPGFARALLRVVDELHEARATPARATQALRAWGDVEPSRAAYAADLAALVSGYHRELERLGVADARVRDAAALDALRMDPRAWGATPVFLYGFDDLTPLQRDAVATLSVIGAPVTVSLTYEPGRSALAARAGVFEELRALPETTVEVLEARADFYAPASRAALHHLERSLFEAEPPPPVEANDAVLLLEAGGERAEVELVGAHVARLIRDDGYAPDEIAVVFRSLRTVAPLVEQVFGGYGIPCAVDRRMAVGHTALGRGLLGLLRAAQPDGTLEDLLAYLRTPGVLDRLELADRLEAAARRAGLRGAAAARAWWEEQPWGWPLGAVERVAGAQRAGPAALCERLAREATNLLTRAHRGSAAILDDDEAVDARVAAELRRALGELARLAQRDPRLVPEPGDLARLLGALEVWLGPSSAPGRVEVTNPLRIRARRVRALFACGLQEGAWPAPARPDPLLGDEERRALAVASGLVLARGQDDLAAERFVFYATVTRPTELLALSWRTSDDEGAPEVPSSFVADVVDRFSPSLRERTVRRRLGQVEWPAGLVPSDREARRALAARRAPAAPLGHDRRLVGPPVLAELGGRRTLSASGLELFAACPMRWLVERFVRPGELEPEPEAMLRGTLAHRVLRDVMAALGPHPLRPGDLPAAQAALREALARHAPELPISVNPERLRAQLRRLEADLTRYLDHAARASSAYAPTHLEHDVEAQLADDLRLAGTIDRIDVCGRQAVVYDYKGKTATSVRRWVEDRALQIGLYILAVRAALDLDPVGGLYQPLGGPEGIPRGAMVADADPGQRLVSTDRVDAAAFEAALQEVLALARTAARELRAGRIEARPSTCAYRGGCAHPAICRAEAS